MHILFYFILRMKFSISPIVLLLTAFVDITSVISMYHCITLQTLILNGISESGTPATYADMLLTLIHPTKSLSRPKLQFHDIFYLQIIITLVSIGRIPSSCASWKGPSTMNAQSPHSTSIKPQVERRHLPNLPQRQICGQNPNCFAISLSSIAGL